MVVGISCRGVSCLPAPAPQLPLASATLLGSYGHHFPWFFRIPPPFASHLRNSRGACLQVPGLPRHCPPLGWLPSFQQVINQPDMKLCKHREGTTDLFSEALGCFTPSQWGAKLLPPNPNVRLAEKLLYGAVGTELPPLQSTSLPAAVFAFSLVLR